MQIWEEYIRSVETGQRNAGRLEKLAVQHVKKLARLYDFDEQEAERVLNLTHLFKHTKGKWKGKPFNLLPHQAFFVAFLFGLKNKNGFRLIREAMINMAKKGGKSELGGAIGIICTFFDGENTAEGYIVANKTEQALFAWKSAKGIATQLATDFPNDFGADFKFYDNKQEHTLIQKSSENFLRTLPYSSSDLDGCNPHYVDVDEFHEYPDTTVPDNLQSGMVLRDQSLMLYTTTRGFHPYGPLADKEEYYNNVLTGLVDDHRVFPLIFSLDNDNKWKNKNYWIQFAPGLDANLPSYEALEAEMKAALDEGGEKLNSCKVKNFNIWQRSKSAFAEKSGWEKGNEPLPDLSGRRCISSFDIGRIDDLSVLGHLFEPTKEDPRFPFLARGFMPSELVDKRSKEHKVSYKQWIDEGLIIETEGNITDTAVVLEQIVQDGQDFDIVNMFADQTFALELINKLSVLGHPIQNFPQRYGTMNAPILYFQKIINGGLFWHGGNKMLSWMFTNVTLKKDTGGRVMMDKSDRITGKGKDHKKGRKKIDGMVVAAMCFGGFLDELAKNQSNIYEQGVRYL